MDKFNISLRDLGAMFIRYEEKQESWNVHMEDGAVEEVTGLRAHHIAVATIAEAQGVRFLCPLCFHNNSNSSIGVHSVICWSSSRGVPSYVKPLPGRWLLVGTGIDNLTLGREPTKTRSILLTGDGCKWHGFVTDGYAT